MSRIEEEFRAVGIQRGGVLMLRPDDAIAMVRRCRERNVRVLGIDGFFLTEKTTQPSMEHSVDLSGPESFRPGYDSWGLAESFVAERAPLGMFFEVVVADPENQRGRQPRIDPR